MVKTNESTEKYFFYSSPNIEQKIMKGLRDVAQKESRRYF